ncbi:hypothetical protein EII33_02830 [Bacteroides heparinolyticus]|uniref:Transmembrane protein n=1 Tax=Prevotella heparinolytica TaxID=28113 RepID=A0A3P2AGC2_9BACE|nr:hypothetical protein EII33_02830 [Bacteroides heparinolyticus]
MRSYISLHVIVALLLHFVLSYPKMYKVSENGHLVFCPLLLLSVIYDFGMVLVLIQCYVRKQ